MHSHAGAWERVKIEVKRALMRLNSRLRKDLNFKIPALIMGEHRVALAA
ncbi:MAG: hypothetical protein QS721_13315 [Candidatus Endonucleobacter sp. (ex Gigantidas childressi)]|nr:hypothetical protein [Candidatus Endonucleobacter sp. (ex Gigantidas childressi)]